MPRPKGLPKTGGMQKGYKFEQTKLLEQVTKQLGRDPLTELVNFYQATGDPSLKLTALKEICSYCHVKPKAIELTGADGEELFPPAQPRTVEELAQIAILVRHAMHGPKRVE